MRIFAAAQFWTFISCNGWPKASVIFKGSASHSSGSSQEVCYNGGQNGQRRCRPTDTQGGNRGSHEAVLNDMSSVLKRWRLRCFPVWILKCKHVPLCWPVASLWAPPTETQCLHTCFFLKDMFKNTRHLRYDRNVCVCVCVHESN